MRKIKFFLAELFIKFHSTIHFIFVILISLILYPLYLISALFVILHNKEYKILSLKKYIEFFYSDLK